MYGIGEHGWPRRAQSALRVQETAMLRIALPLDTVIVYLLKGGDMRRRKDVMCEKDCS